MDKKEMFVRVVESAITNNVPKFYTGDAGKENLDKLNDLMELIAKKIDELYPE